MSLWWDSSTLSPSFSDHGAVEQAGGQFCPRSQTKLAITTSTVASLLRSTIEAARRFFIERPHRSSWLGIPFGHAGLAAGRPLYHLRKGKSPLSSNPLVLSTTVLRELTAIRRAAGEMPRSIKIPGRFSFNVSYAEERGPQGAYRRLSMDVERPGYAPSSRALEAVAEELGFVGGLPACSIWEDDLEDGRVARNLAQPMPATAGQAG